MSRYTHWVAVGTGLVAATAVYVAWFFPATEYDSESPPARYSTIVWLVTVLVLIVAGLVAEARRHRGRDSDGGGSRSAESVEAD